MEADHLEADHLIVGGGPVGLSAAIFAAKAGSRVRVLERARGPVDKGCGEGLMPPAVRTLASLGVELPAWGVHPFRGIRYVDGDVTAEADFPDGEALGVRRLALSEGLRARARALGVTIDEGVEVVGVEAARERVEVSVAGASSRLSARYLLCADGLHSPTRKLMGVATSLGPARRHGIRQHYTVQPWSPYVEVWWADGLEAYVTPTGPQRVGVAMLWSGGPGNMGRFLERFPALRDKLGPVESQPRGAGPFDLRVERRVSGRVLWLGDAAGYLDAITGEGIALGLETAEAAVHLTLAGTPEAYEAAWWRLTRRHRWLTGLLLRVASMPWLRRRVVRALAKEPAAFAAMLGLNTGATGVWQVLVRGWRVPGRVLLAG